MTLLENGPPLALCVNMTVYPAAAILVKEVVVTLSAVESTGIRMKVNVKSILLKHSKLEVCEAMLMWGYFCLL